jgi:diguanylate cyclase (GGDEF)-like protein
MGSRPFLAGLLLRLSTLLLLSWATGATAQLPESMQQLSAKGESYRLSAIARYLEDPERRLTVDALAADPSRIARMLPAGSTAQDPNFGYSSSAYWLALPLKLDSDAPSRWLLEIGYSSLDRVEVYTPRPVGGPGFSGGYDVQATGDLQPFSQRLYPHRNLVFPLQLAPGAAQTVYVRVVSDGNLTVPLTLWQPEALHHHDQFNYAVLSLYFGMLLALSIYNLLLYLSARDPVFLGYVAFCASMALAQASLVGFGNQFLWPAWPQWGNIAVTVANAAAGFFGALFTRQFLGTQRLFPRFDRAILILAGLFAVAALAPLVASYRFSAILTSVVGLAFAVVAVACGVYGLAKGHPGARYFLLAWTALLVGVATLALRNLAWLPTNAWTLYSMQIGSALEMLLLSFALADRINGMRRAKEQADREALAAKQAMVESLQRSEHQLESRVEERTRDLEEINARLRESEHALHHMARHDPLTGLPNRMVLDDRLLQAIARARRSRRSAAALLIDLDGFKAVNDNHGHDAGDQLLVMAAERLTQCVRDTDTVVRLGGDEFVVLLENLNSAAEAAQIAEKLLAQVGRPYPLDRGTAKIGLSIGIALTPQDATDAQQLLKRADQAMYAAKSAGRNCWRAASSGTGGDPVQALY